MRFLLTLSLLLTSPAYADDLETLASWMTGSFSSQAQSEADEDFFDIRLEMAPIWTGREDAVWMYVEQAAASNLDQPYRQRIYRLTEGPPGTFTSEIFAMSEPLSFAGAWRDEDPLAQLGPEDLSPREGCAVVLRRSDDNTFAGSTVGHGCVSNIRGSAYATSEVSVTAAGIESWDRGYFENGEQAWGAEKGPYVFLRR